MVYSSQENSRKMKKYIVSIFTIISISAFGQIQISIPETPKKIEFADVIINLDEESRKEVDKTVNSLLTPQNSFLDAKLERMQWYFPIIERILDEEDVPDDLKYIAVMESSLIPEALSTSSAVGFWQFKKPTGEELGLVINNDIDERKYIHESTRAAALYFKRNNLIFKNWISSIYSYNQGPTGAASEIPDEWSYASQINFTSKTPGYLIKALAHRIAFEHRINRLKSSPRMFIEYPTKAKSLAEIAAELTVDISELRKYNAWLNAAAIPDGKLYTILIPVKKEDADEIKNRINQKRDFVKVDVGFPQLVKSESTPDGTPLYSINDKRGILAQPGDEAAQLAKKGNTKIFNFLKFNDMSDRDMVKTGQVYYLQKKGKKAKIPFHTVSGEQTLWDISQMYGVQLKRLLKYNRLSSIQRLQPGRVVWLQKTRPKNTPVEIIREAIPSKPQEEQKLPGVETYTPVQKTEETSPKPVIIEEEKVIEEKPAVVLDEKPLIIEKEKPQVVIIAEDDAIYNSPAPKKKSVFENKQEEPTSEFNGKSDDYEYSNTAKTHRVARGETLFSISKKYGLSVNELRTLNNMTSADILQFDQVLKVTKSYNQQTEIPKTAPVKTENRTAKNEKTVVSTGSHIVTSGETLFSISKKYGMSVAALKSLNGLNDNFIIIGQSLKVTGGNNNTSTLGKSTYLVRAGDTLYSISKKHNTSVDQLKAWNNINSNSISVGQVLEIR